MLSLLTNMAQASLKLGDEFGKEAYEDAVEYATRALFLDSRAVKALFRRALALRQLGDHTSVLKDAEEACRLEPHNKEIRRWLGIIEVRWPVMWVDQLTLSTQWYSAGGKS